MQPPEPCPENTPGTACWCENHPNSNHPGCRTVSIDYYLYPLLTILLISIVILKSKKYKIFKSK